jgi:1-acyl-sn-glycerol-3-phosphate acyltransferase
VVTLSRVVHHARRRGSPLDPTERSHALMRLARSVCDAHDLDVRLEGRLPEHPAVLVANHVSYLDPVVIASLVPCAPIAKIEVRSWPLFGPTLRDLGALFVRRGDPHSGAKVLRRGIRLLAGGTHLLAFPEGTTTAGDTVRPFHRGVFGAARLIGVPVVPLTIRLYPKSLCWIGSEPFLPHYLRTAARPRAGISVHAGQPLHPDAFDGAQTLARAARVAIRHRLELGDVRDGADGPGPTILVETMPARDRERPQRLGTSLTAPPR